MDSSNPFETDDEVVADLLDRFCDFLHGKDPGAAPSALLSMARTPRQRRLLAKKLDDLRAVWGIASILSGQTDKK